MGRDDKINISDLPPRQRRELLGLEPIGDTTPKRHKYGVGKKEDRTLDGIVFDSIREMKRYCELKLMENAGVIERLQLQPKWDLHVKGIKVATYAADFKYYDGKVWVWEDAKGVRTQIFNLKVRMLRAEYGIEIKEA
jgi:hypothetical protein